jgi:hypothetical protein
VGSKQHGLDGYSLWLTATTRGQRAEMMAEEHRWVLTALAAARVDGSGEHGGDSKMIGSAWLGCCGHRRQREELKRGEEMWIEQQPRSDWAHGWEGRARVRAAAVRTVAGWAVLDGGAHQQRPRGSAVLVCSI